MNKELAVLLTIKKKFQSLINNFTDIINSSSETTHYINSFFTTSANATSNTSLNHFINMYNNTFDERVINDTIIELKQCVDALNIEIYNRCNHCFVCDHIEDQFGRIDNIEYCEICGLDKDIYSV